MKFPFREAILWISLGLNVALIAGIAIYTTNRTRSQPFGDGNRIGMRLPGPPPFPLEVDLIARKLGLDDSQRAQVEAILERAKTQFTADFSEMHTVRGSIFRAVIQTPEDEEAIRKLLDENAGAPEKFGRSIVQHLREIVLILTPDQRKLLLKEFEQFERMDMIMRVDESTK